MLRIYLNMSLKFKIIILFSVLMTVFSLILGYYAFQTSKTQIVNKVSLSNLGVMNVVESNMTQLQRAVNDWVTVFSIAPVVQNSLQYGKNSSDSLESDLYDETNATLMNQMFVTGNLDYVAVYRNSGSSLFQTATDGSSGALPMSSITASQIYSQTAKLQGASYWFPLIPENNFFIADNRKEKIGMSRIVRNVNNGQAIGFIFVGVNKETVLKRYLANLYDQNHGIAILDENGAPLLTAGMPFYEGNKAELALERSGGKNSESKIVHVGGQDLLLSYNAGTEGWQILYAVPLNVLTKELNSIKLFVVMMIAGWLLLSIPILMLLTSFLTAPIKNLLLSMRRFQNGQFDERVDVKYGDEIGYLTSGYNSMVANIKLLVDDVYVLRLREQEAEFKALQSQINPHFLYNMLDTIFWEAESAGQERISEMTINLSRLFRLSLNRGKSFTSVAKERELLELYLKLQKMRFNESLDYRIAIPDEIGRFVIPKLSLQPFVENAIVHGVERKRGGGHVSISGFLAGEFLRFVIEDDGPGMDEEAIRKITEIPSESEVYTAQDTGGYAVQNVIERLRLFYKDQYRLDYHSEPGKGTRVEIMIPRVAEDAGGTAS